MSKINKIFSSIFSKSKQQLETDAVPVPDEYREPHEAVVEEIQNSTQLPISSELVMAETSQQLIPSPINSVDLNELQSRLQPNNNNMLAINNQDQHVYNFSNINKLHIGSVYKIKTPEIDRRSDDRKESGSKPVFYTRTIQTMLQSEEPLHSRYLSEISKHLGEGWKDIMRQLKFSEGQIHQAFVDFHIDGGTREVIYQLLLDWSQNEDSATLGKLASILWTSGHKDTVYYLKQCYKAERNANNAPKSEKYEI